jgi:hypothetical protein
VCVCRYTHTHTHTHRVILSKKATVGDLQDVLFERTQIPIELQEMVRINTGASLNNRSERLVDSL